MNAIKAMKKALTILYILIFLSVFNICYADESQNYINNEASLSIEVEGFAGNDGRIIIRQYRTYLNPEEKLMEVRDKMHFPALPAKELVDYKILRKSDDLLYKRKMAI
ncbi:MAG: hypothetical protein GXX10_03540 [Clostridiaceae bacterium]|nr:hypothetical protein [Clostridiaceae bacterium]